MPYVRVLENVILNETLLLDGANWNNTLIRNVIIEDVDGSGIILRDVENVRIENVTIRNVTGDGIKLSTLGSTSGVVIADSVISQIGDDGINAGQRADEEVDHPGLQIIGNTIEDVGLNETGAGLLHGIYVQSTDFVIEGNYISGVADGNGISVRSTGQIIDNFIESARESGIAYFPDNEKGDSDQLVISGNVMTDTGQGTDRSDINLLDVRSAWAEEVVSTILIVNNVLTQPEDSAIMVNSDYANLGSIVSQSGNQFVTDAAAQSYFSTGTYGGTGSDASLEADADLSPGAGVMPALFGNGNMRVTLNDNGIGQTDVLVTLGNEYVADQILDPGTQLALGNIDQIGLKVTAFSGGDAAAIGIDAGRMAVVSDDEEVAFAGAGDMEISDDEALVFSLEEAPIGYANQAVFGLIGGDPGESVSFDLFSRGTFLGTFEQEADDVIQIESDVSFDVLRLSAGEQSGFALSWAEFGQLAVVPINPSAETPTVKTSLDMQESFANDSNATLELDDEIVLSVSVADNTKWSEVNLSELALKVSANGRKVSVDSGMIGVSTGKESGDAVFEISGREELVFNFKQDVRLGDAVSANIELANFTSEEVILIEAFHNGESVGTSSYEGSASVNFGGIGVFDQLAISAGDDSSFSVTALEAIRIDLLDDQFL